MLLTYLITCNFCLTSHVSRVTPNEARSPRILFATRMTFPSPTNSVGLSIIPLPYTELRVVSARAKTKKPDPETEMGHLS